MFPRVSTQASSRLSQVSRLIPTHQIRTMAYANTRFKLNTGTEIPAIGFGTWQDKDAQEDAVYVALKVGYRHIDTARVYVFANLCKHVPANKQSGMAQNQRLREALRRAAFPEKTSSSSPNYGTTTTTLTMLKRHAICR